MKKQLVYSFIFLLAICSSIAITYVVMKDRETKIAFIQVNKVYVEFRLTKELDAKIKSTQQIRKNIIDSLGMELDIVSRKLSVDIKNTELQKTFYMKKQEYLEKEKSFMQDNESQMAICNEQIFKQLNQYMEDYKDESGYDLILGATGDGVVMAANDKLDISQSMIDYVNEKYKGIK